MTGNHATDRPARPKEGAPMSVAIASGRSLAPPPLPRGRAPARRRRIGNCADARVLPAIYPAITPDVAGETAPTKGTDMRGTMGAGFPARGAAVSRSDRRGVHGNGPADRVGRAEVALRHPDRRRPFVSKTRVF